MADFCSQCSLANFGEDYGDLAKLVPAEDYAKGARQVLALCEGCGPIMVNVDGVCCSSDCLRQHKQPEPPKGPPVYIGPPPPYDPTPVGYELPAPRSYPSTQEVYESQRTGVAEQLATDTRQFTVVTELPGLNLPPYKPEYSVRERLALAFNARPEDEQFDPNEGCDVVGEDDHAPPPNTKRVIRVDLGVWVTGGHSASGTSHRYLHRNSSPLFYTPGVDETVAPRVESGKRYLVELVLLEVPDE